jgi:O-antigen/teichoic acid export membrane protein
VKYFAKPVVAIAFGAFFLCAETCLHAEDVLRFASRPLDLPLYDWSAGAFLLITGVLSLREWSTARRQYQAVAWAFMLSLLVAASLSVLSEWLTPPNESEWLSEGWFLVVVVTMTVIALCGLTSTLRAHESR